jgi:hypothetical protein
VIVRGVLRDLCALSDLDSAKSATPVEQRDEDPDEPSLVFTVGVSLFEQLTGHHPFGAASDPDRPARIARRELGSNVQYFLSVPAPLRSILVRSLGPRAEGHSTAEELIAELETFASPSVGAPAPSVAAHVRSPPQRVPASAAPRAALRAKAWRRAYRRGLQVCRRGLQSYQSRLLAYRWRLMAHEWRLLAYRRWLVAHRTQIRGYALDAAVVASLMALRLSC